MAEKRRTREGEYVAGISAASGVPEKKIWEHAENKKLRKSRENPDVLLDGIDEIFVPDPDPKTEEVPVDQRTTFRLAGVPEVLIVHFCNEDGEGREGLEYLFEVEGEARTGTTAAKGELKQPVPPGATTARVALRDGDETEVYELHFSHLDPWDEVTGQQQRLMNLGYDCGPELGDPGLVTEDSVRRFQADRGLEVTGVLDDATVDALRTEYRS